MSNTLDIMENKFIQKYFNNSVDHLKMIFKDLPEAYIKNFVEREIRKYCKDQPIMMKNTYVGFDVKSNLLSFVDYIEREKPIVCGNGSLYKRQSVEKSLLGELFLDMKAQRTKFKDAMFECRKNGDDNGENINDLAQKNQKIVMNSGYGAMGEVHSFVYNISTAAAITSQGRSIISTTMWFNEAFLSNHLIFDTLDDIVHYICCILKEENNLALYDYINYIPTDKEIIEYYMSKYEGKENRVDVYAALVMIVNNCNSSQKIKLFYKNNLYGLLDNNDKVRNHIIDNIINNPIDYMDPYKIPEELVPAMDLAWNIIEEFVYLKDYIIYDKVYKYNNHKRKVVMYSDTDSVFIYVGEWVFKFIHYIFGIDVKDIRMSHLDKHKDYVLKIINVITKFIYIAIHKTYDTLLNNNNVEPEYRKYVHIKNEFLMDRLIMFENTKKNYICRTIVNEGKMLNPPRFETKGTNLNAKSKNTLITAKVNEIVKEVTMGHERIYPEELLYKMDLIKQEIVTSLQSGSMEYATPVKVKEIESYKNPYSDYRIKGIEAYRIAEDDKDITLPGEFNIINVEIPTVESMEWMKTAYPLQYERLKKGYFGNEKLKSGGINYICFPMRLEKIPGWVIPYINLKDTWRNHTNPLTTLSGSLGLKIDKHDNKNYYSSVMKF